MFLSVLSIIDGFDYYYIIYQLLCQVFWLFLDTYLDHTILLFLGCKTCFKCNVFISNKVFRHHHVELVSVLIYGHLVTIYHSLVLLVIGLLLILILMKYCLDYVSYIVLIQVRINLK